MRRTMSANTNAPSIQKRCPECNRLHFDENFVACVECGASLTSDSSY